jgi:hypothetical protein
MARISTYGVDAIPELGDKMIGTDAASGAAFNTKNYKLSDIAATINKTNSLGVADQLIYFFQTDISEGRKHGSISFEAGNGTLTPFNQITELIFSKALLGGKTIEHFLPLFIGKSIILAQLNNLNNFGTYLVQNIVESISEPNFFVVTLENIEYNGVISDGGNYIFSEFARPISNDDKNFVFNQVVPSTTWTVTHNLNKFPSVSVVDTGGTVVVGSYTYDSDNQTTLNFTHAFAGKAYFN